MRKLLLLLFAGAVSCLAFAQTYRVREVNDVLKAGSKGKLSSIVKWDYLSSTTRITSKKQTGTLSIYDCRTRRLLTLEINGGSRLLSDYVSDQDKSFGSALIAVIHYIQKEYKQLDDDHYQMFHTKGGTTRGLSLSSSNPFLHKNSKDSSDLVMMMPDLNQASVSQLVISNPFQQARFAYVLMQTPSDTTFLPLFGNDCALPVPPGEKKTSTGLFFTESDFKQGFRLSLLWSNYLLSKEDCQLVLETKRSLLANCIWLDYRP
ncbi:MAG: hypothetical protein Q8914_07140 [Bacteroidota bacterium]|nr:hypothetical protein [Bacteroidota bacterium]